MTINYQASAIFRGTERVFGAGPAGCRIVWPGPMPASGKPLMVGQGKARRNHQRAAYSLRWGRTLKSDRVVALCENPRCLDHRHLRIIPEAKTGKAGKALPAAAAP